MNLHDLDVDEFNNRLTKLAEEEKSLTAPVQSLKDSIHVMGQIRYA